MVNLTGLMERSVCEAYECYGRVACAVACDRPEAATLAVTTGFIQRFVVVLVVAAVTLVLVERAGARVNPFIRGVLLSAAWTLLVGGFLGVLYVLSIQRGLL